MLSQGTQVRGVRVDVPHAPWTSLQNSFTNAVKLKDTLYNILYNFSSVEEILIAKIGNVTTYEIDELEHFKSAYPQLTLKAVELPDEMAECISFEHRHTDFLRVVVGDDRFGSLCQDRPTIRTPRPYCMESSIPISLLMTVHGDVCPSHLNQALLSIIHQNVLPKELVLVVDGPIGRELREILSALQRVCDHGVISMHLTLVDRRWGRKHGLASALNEGLKYTLYRWVARMDSDDISLPHRLSIQWETIASKLEMNESIDLLFSSVFYFEQTPDISDCTILLPRCHKALFEHFKWLHCLYHPTVIFNRDLVVGIGGYDQDFEFAQDFNLWQRCLEAGAMMHCVQEPLLYYRVTEAQDSRRKKAVGALERCLWRAYSNGWLTSSELQGALIELRQRVSSLPFDLRKIQRKLKYHVDWTGRRIVLPAPVLLNIPISRGNSYWAVRNSAQIQQAGVFESDLHVTNQMSKNLTDI